MEDGDEIQRWDELIPDALGLIFKNLPLLEILTVVPRVCKSWGRAVIGPYCWQEIDIEEWSKNAKPEIVDRMLQILITRSCGSFQKLVVHGLARDDSFFFIANHALSLRTLQLPRSEIKDTTLEKAVMKLSNLTYLDLSYCINIGAQAIEAIGKHCKFLTTFQRIMHPLEVMEKKLSQNDEALAIATTMPRLKHLEIAYLLVDTEGIIGILQNCKQLELLDIRGCWDVELDEKFVKRFSNLEIVGPIVQDCYEMNGWDNLSDDSESFAEMLEDDDFFEDEEYEWWFYGNGAADEEEYDWQFYDNNAIEDYEWPQSP